MNLSLPVVACGHPEPGLGLTEGRAGAEPEGAVVLGEGSSMLACKLVEVVGGEGADKQERVELVSGEDAAVGRESSELEPDQHLRSASASLARSPGSTHCDQEPAERSAGYLGDLSFCASWLWPSSSKHRTGT
eukprot:1689099-Rhodomonas_salina.5